MTPHLKHIIVGGGTSVTSSLTRRDLVLNTDLIRFRVPPSFTAAGAAAAENAFLAVLGALPNQSERRRPEGGADWPLLLHALAARTPAALAAALDPLLEGLFASGKPNRFGEGLSSVGLRRGPLQGRSMERRVLQLVVMLWRHGCLLAPLADFRFGLFFGSRWLPTTEEFYGPATDLIVFPYPTRTTTSQMNRIVLSVHGLKEIGDLSREVLVFIAEATRERSHEAQAAVDALVPGLFLSTGPTTNKYFVATCNDLASAQRVVYANRPEIVSAVPQSYADVRPDRTRQRRRLDTAPTRDTTFAWIRRDFPACAAWAPMLAEHIASAEGMLDLRVLLSHLNLSLRLLFSSESPPLSPTDACRQPKTSAALLKAGLEARNTGPVTANARVLAMKNFFAWVIRMHGHRADGTLDPQLSNPCDLVRSFGKHRRKAQSDRPKMPAWLMQKAVEVLRGDDYAWPRSRVRSDYFEAVEDGEVRVVWSPVLAEMMLLRFLLPVRTIQARLLGSGEGDTWVWQPVEVSGAPDSESGTNAAHAALTAGRWVRNMSEWAPTMSGDDVSLGMLRRIFDPEAATWTNGLYIPTNKTADKVKGWADLGYEVPWVNAEILAIFDRVRRFQQRYNPARPPKSRAELAGESAIINPEIAPLLPKMHYLFRDPAHPSTPDEPVTSARATTFWHDMMSELEQRLASDPDVPRNPDGSLPQLVERDNNGRARTSKYDMHGVRVTGLTRLALGGCPVEVLMMLAGHSTWVMTLYYVKMSPGDVRRSLDAAEAKLEELDVKDFDEVLASADLAKLRALRFALSDAGQEQLSGVDEALVGQSDIGLCPNGGTLCHIGGKTIAIGNGAKGVHGPVSGGALNCQSCRFFVSGPQYLGGIIARLNALSIQVQTAGERLSVAEQHRRELVAKRRLLESEVPAELLRRLRSAATNVESAEAHAEDLGDRWHNLYRLFDRCLKSLRELMRRADEGQASGGRNLLVLNGTADDVKIALQRCTDIALWNRVCYDSEVVGSLETTEAAMRRGMRLDHVLAQSGRPAVFAGLSDPERIAVGNAFARWLETRLGRVGADDIYEGRRTLAEAGLLDDVDLVLPQDTSRSALRAQFPSARHLLPASTP